MVEDDKLVFEQKFHDYVFNIRQAMQIVQTQFDVMNNAIDKCSGIEKENAKECIVALTTAHNEILRFLEVNIALAKLIDEFTKYCIVNKL